MIERRLVQWYAADAGVDLDIAEREIALTYVLRILADQGLLDQLAFKGGTALRKLYLGSIGRFSLDLDFTAVSETDPDALILDLVGALDELTYYGLTFTIPSPNYYATGDSCGAEITYHHDWVTAGRFGLQISFWAQPLLPVQPMALRPERYFDWLGIDPPSVPSLDLHELVGEKLRAAAQRSRVRDLYDLYQLARQPYDRDLVRRIAIVKCWETHFAFDPAAFLSGLAAGRYDWSDLARLVRPDRLVAPADLVRDVQRSYTFLEDLTPDEAQLAVDPYGREVSLHRQLVAAIQTWGTLSQSPTDDP
ncbi:MAG: nucleotidyl transferase AbiEii/AbiGii toxin family protein [Armatimonadetes bacterium]|nr:nucleotidyl transferase AbiEii/AbiGii toxin family protein [Armatimonadota bacterium]